MTLICVSKLTTIGSYNGLAPGRRQAIIWTNAGMLIGPLGSNFSEILVEILTFSFKQMQLKVSSAKWRPFCLCLNGLNIENYSIVVRLIQICSALYHLYSSARHPWWRHPRELFSASLAICAGNSPVTVEFPTQTPMTRSFDVFFDLRLDKRLSKESRGWWFQTPLWSLWRHCNVLLVLAVIRQ